MILIVCSHLGVIHKTFQGSVSDCDVKLTAVQWFVTPGNGLLSEVGGIYSSWDFARQAGCHAAPPPAPPSDVLVRRLIDAYQLSQNTMNASLAASLFASNASVWVPAGSGAPVVGRSNVFDFFSNVFATLTSLRETVVALAVNNNFAGYEKRFQATALNGCQLDVPVLMWFELDPSFQSIVSLRGLWNITLFNQQLQCK